MIRDKFGPKFHDKPRQTVEMYTYLITSNELYESVFAC